MDARIDPFASLGLKEGEAHVIRNAGGRASDAIRSIVISQRLLGTTEVVIFHHTDCGMLTFSDKDLRDQIKASDGASVAPHVDQLAFLPFN
ncbi:Beta-carbonic anhydrase 1, partial [Ceratobasidium sp. 394]